LPDPDKIYGPAADEDADSEEISAKRRHCDDDDDDDDDVHAANSSDEVNSGSESSIDSDTSQSSDRHRTRCVSTVVLKYSNLYLHWFCFTFCFNVIFL